MQNDSGKQNDYFNDDNNPIEIKKDFSNEYTYKKEEENRETEESLNEMKIEYKENSYLYGNVPKDFDIFGGATKTGEDFSEDLEKDPDYIESTKNSEEIERELEEEKEMAEARGNKLFFVIFGIPTILFVAFVIISFIILVICTIHNNMPV